MQQASHPNATTVSEADIESPHSPSMDARQCTDPEFSRTRVDGQAQLFPIEDSDDGLDINGETRHSSFSEPGLERSNKHHDTSAQGASLPDELLTSMGGSTYLGPTTRSRSALPGATSSSLTCLSRKRRRPATQENDDTPEMKIHTSSTSRKQSQTATHARRTGRSRTLGTEDITGEGHTVVTESDLPPCGSLDHNADDDLAHSLNGAHTTHETGGMVQRTPMTDRQRRLSAGHVVSSGLHDATGERGEVSGRRDSSNRRTDVLKGGHLDEGSWAVSGSQTLGTQNRGDTMQVCMDMNRPQERYDLRDRTLTARNHRGEPPIPELRRRKRARPRDSRSPVPPRQRYRSGQVVGALDSPVSHSIITVDVTDTAGEAEAHVSRDRYRLRRRQMQKSREPLRSTLAAQPRSGLQNPILPPFDHRPSSDVQTKNLGRDTAPRAPPRPNGIAKIGVQKPRVKQQHKISHSAAKQRKRDIRRNNFQSSNDMDKPQSSPFPRAWTKLSTENCVDRSKDRHDRQKPTSSASSTRYDLNQARDRRAEARSHRVDGHAVRLATESDTITQASMSPIGGQARTEVAELRRSTRVAQRNRAPDLEARIKSVRTGRVCKVTSRGDTVNGRPRGTGNTMAGTLKADGCVITKVIPPVEMIIDTAIQDAGVPVTDQPDFEGNKDYDDASEKVKRLNTADVRQDGCMQAQRQRSATDVKVGLAQTSTPPQPSRTLTQSLPEVTHSPSGIKGASILPDPWTRGLSSIATHEGDSSQGASNVKSNLPRIVITAAALEGQQRGMPASSTDRLATDDSVKLQQRRLRGTILATPDKSSDTLMAPEMTDPKDATTHPIEVDTAEASNSTLPGDMLEKQSSEGVDRAWGEPHSRVPRCTPRPGHGRSVI